jgi:hypothetical protein
LKPEDKRQNKKKENGRKRESKKGMEKERKSGLFRGEVEFCLNCIRGGANMIKELVRLWGRDKKHV